MKTFALATIIQMLLMNHFKMNALPDVLEILMNFVEAMVMLPFTKVSNVSQNMIELV